MLSTKELAMEILGFYPPEEKKRRIWTDENGGTEYDLTPERAKFIYENFNEKNRELSTSQLANIKESEQEHGWIDDGDVLRFCQDGNIPEWQHRLKYIADNNIPDVKVEIRFGVKNGASTKTANAKARTPYDKLSISDKTATKNEVSTLKKIIEFRVYRSNPKGKELTWNTADDLWPKWKKYARRGEALTKDFFENTSDWSTYRRVFAAWAGLLSFHGKEEIATTFLKMLEDVTKGREGTCLAREWEKRATDKEVAKMSNGRRPQYYYQLLCIAADRIEKDKSGDIQMGVNVSDVNHDRLVQSGNYRLFLENPDSVQPTIVITA